jgi:hypothetical protein
MKPLRWNAVSVAALVLVLCASTAALGVPTIAFSPLHTQVDLMSYFFVDVSVNNEVLGITGYDFLIVFDEAIIQVDNVSEGGLPAGYPGDTFFFWSDEGHPASVPVVTGGERNVLLIQGAILGGSVNGPGSLATIRFYAPTPGTSPLTFLVADLRDLNNNPIAATAVDGDVVVTPGVAIEPASWGAIKALYLE